MRRSIAFALAPLAAPAAPASGQQGSGAPAPVPLPASGVHAALGVALLAGMGRAGRRARR